MAVHDHKAPARPPFHPLGDAFAAPSVASRPVVAAQASSSHLATLDDIAIAIFALSRLQHYCERCDQAPVRLCSAGRVDWPLPPMFAEGVSTAIRCLQQYAEALDR